MIELTANQIGPGLDRRVADALGIVECNQWERTNFGAAGGPAVIKRCDHKRGFCYAPGWLPNFSFRMHEAWEAASWIGPVTLSTPHAPQAAEVLNGDWFDVELLPPGFHHYSPVTGQGETAALALCAAILGAKEAGWTSPQ